MPLPSKQPKETRKEFMDRCISDPKTREEFKDIKQRIAVCISQFDKSKKKSS
jgi:hypothetical protein